MAQQTINVGTNPNDGTGDTLRGAFIKTDDNFTELYSGKQNTLISGTNIKTINSTSLLGSGNVSVQATLVSGTNIKTINGNSLLGSGDLTISGGITGSGTDNYIPRFNGTTALENSIIFDDGTNVGIGTASPISKFNLVGGAASFDFGGFANIPAIKLLASGDEPTLRFYRPSGGTPNARIFQIQNTVGDLTFGYALANKYSESTFTETMRITSAGYVGIGTSSPVTLLDLGSSTGQKLSIYSSGNDRAGFGIETSTLRYYTPTGSIHSFGHLSNSDGVTFSERMQIDSSGNVGIGISSPLSRLHVEGTSDQIIISGGTIQSLTSVAGGSMINYDDSISVWGLFSDVFTYNITDEAFYLNSIIVNDTNNSVNFGAKKLPNATSFTNSTYETLIGVYDSSTTDYETSIYAKRNIYCGASSTTTILTIAEPNSAIDLVAKIGYGDRFFIAKVSVMVDWNALTYTYKITNTNTTNFDDSDSLNINFEFSFAGAEFVVQINNTSGNDIYSNINANIL
jgi:hypothetical protein